MTTEVIVAICLGFFIGMILGRILWYKDGKRIKLQERIIDYYKDMVGYLKENLSKEYCRNHDIMMNNIDNIFQKIENSLLPKTPETCPKCGAKYSGGSTAPGDHMQPDMRVFYMCGASISLKDWGKDDPCVLLKNCSELEEPVEIYPVMSGHIVYVLKKKPIEFYSASVDKKVGK